MPGREEGKEKALVGQVLARHRSHTHHYVHFLWFKGPELSGVISTLKAFLRPIKTNMVTSFDINCMIGGQQPPL